MGNRDDHASIDPTEVSDVVAVAASAPTEMAGVADAETAASYAWALDDSQELDARRMTPRRITAAAIAASLAAMAGAGVVAFVHLRGRTVEPVAATATPTTTAPTPVAAPPPPAPPQVTVTTVVVQSTEPPHAPPPPSQVAAPVMSTWTYDVNWGGSPTLAVLEYSATGAVPVTIVADERIGTGTGFTGDLIGVDPIIDGPITWASCTLYVDGVVAKSDSAVRGDGHDVSCLVRLTR